jgi:hypothetical protein
VLTVVEHQQHVPVGQVPPQHITRYVQRSANAEHTRRHSRNVFWRVHQGKINQPNAIGSLPRLTTPQLDGHSGLPHASWAGQRHQPGSAQHLADRLKLSCAADLVP